MAAPSTAILRLDYSLSYSQFNLEMNRRGYVGLKVFPSIPVDFQSAVFRKMKIADVLKPVQDTRRGEDGTYKPVSFSWTSDNYATADHGLRHDLDDREAKKYKDMINQEIIGAMLILNGVLQDYENQCATLAQDTSQITQTSAVTNKWSVHGSATPVDDLLVGMKVIRNATGLPFSKMTATIGEDALTDAKRCDSVINQIKYDGKHDATIPNDVIVGMLCQMTGLAGINVAAGWKNTAGLDAGDGNNAATLSRLWDQSKITIHVADKAMGQLEAPVPRLGNTIQWKDEAAMPTDDTELALYIEEYRNENVRGGTMRGRVDYALKLMQAECGYILTNIQ